MPANLPTPVVSEELRELVLDLEGAVLYFSDTYRERNARTALLRAIERLETKVNASRAVTKAALRVYREGTGAAIGDFNDTVRSYIDRVAHGCENCNGSGVTGTNHTNLWPCECVAPSDSTEDET